MSKEKAKEKAKDENQQSKAEAQEAAKEEARATEEESKQEETQEQKLEKELAAQKEAHLRLAAEYDNYRKRTQNEKLQIYDDATAKAVAELLPIADSIDMAVQNTKDAPEEFVKGIELIKNQLDKSFEKLKVEAFAQTGDDFDPAIHNAISKIDSEDFGENKISQVFQRGYRLGDKIIRHAMVQVANC
ncbi:MAG: nucleotide exchange factor GrpE [Acutalibacteraceae bacterium]